MNDDRIGEESDDEHNRLVYRDSSKYREWLRRVNPDLASRYASELSIDLETAPYVATETNKDIYEYIKRIIACKAVTPSERLTGVTLAMVSRGVTTSVYCSLDRLSEATRSSKGDESRRRQRLVEAGWLLDTGRRRGNTAVYELTKPASCGCGCLARGLLKGVGDSTT